MRPNDRALSRSLNIADLRSRARRRLPTPVSDFLEGGAEDEATLIRNREAFSEWGLVPRAFRDVSQVSGAVKILGQNLEWPLIVSPTGGAGLFHPDGEIGLAMAAAATGTLYCLSAMASRSIEEVAQSTTAPKAFQLYIFRDRGLTRELVLRAKAAGYAALILAIDVPVPANRERDKRTGMTIPPRFDLASLLAFARHPAWCWNTLVRQPVKLANFSDMRAEPGTTLLNFINSQFEPQLSWADLEWVAGLWGGPIAVKGLLHGDDVERAVAAGASTIFLSNHGGRQLDAAVSGLDMLEQTAERMAGRAELIVDGGIRRGTDILKAVALGASACSTGRVGLYGLTVGGRAGATRALQLLRTEYERDMALLGARRQDEIERSCVRRLR
ncbi:alpha-hydroxy acid oxidase [Sphingopyxis sp. MSC1_008]|jgi:L-lactate dehydrogenase (cytochrome)|uniref:alpha-hydroxy acid oxidase n=1 Tax=Sphingopyxis sp. MSC1_008 TaxID=2909265 RepID=UPI0020C17AC2|nr:alpha-hydroxy acid oxidase [Sphingopyxis sp. MSC1_008]